VPDDQEPDPNGRAIDETAIGRVNAFWYPSDPTNLYFAIDVQKYTPAVCRRISRRTFIRALEVANGERMIRTHYCCVGSDFEGIVNGMDRADRVVQVVLLTGALRPMNPPELTFNDFEDVWITSLKDLVDLTIQRTPTSKGPIKVDTDWKPDTDVVYAAGQTAGQTIGTIRPRRES
jgi:hypothetical protein